MSEIEKVLNAINALKGSVEGNIKKTEEIKDMLVATNKKLEGMEKELKTTKRDCKELMKLNKTQSRKIKVLDREIRVKNLVLYGLQVDPDNDMSSEILKVFNTKLGVNCLESDICFIRKLGNNLNKPIFLVKFESERKRNEILYKRFHLKGTSIVLTEDFPQEIREERKVLYKYYKQAQEKGVNIKLRYNYVIVNSRKLFYDDIIEADDIQVIQKKKKTPQKRFTRKRSSEKETSQTEDSSRPSTPKTTQLDQWLNTPDRDKLKKVLKKQKTATYNPAASSE